MAYYSKLEKDFEEIFKSASDRIYFAPGRVNLIGEHIDYNGGHVLPCALDVGITLLVKDRNDDKLRLSSFNYKKKEILEISLKDLVYKEEDNWTNYPKGIFSIFQKHGYEIPHGFDVFVYGDIPGSGLSSSAALEVAFATLLNDTFSFHLSKEDIAVFSKEAECEFCHLNCGIMDQFASANGKKDMALFLDCSTLKVEYVPFNLKGYKLVITNSNKPHSLISSHYNDRRRECEEALALLQKEVPVSHLCELSSEEYKKHEHLIKDPILRKRSSFCILEEERTLKAKKALMEGDLGTFCEMINLSGDGLRYDYDATCFEIDALVNIQRAQKGCLASRETGGGWGGNTISIVKEEDVDTFRKNVEEEYFKKTSLHAGINILGISEGGRRIK